jgi:hypothetical protein
MGHTTLLVEEGDNQAAVGSAPARLEDAPRARSRVADLLRMPVVAGVLLLVIYTAMTIAFNDPRGTLGTDTGGKLATLQAMKHAGSLDPDVGYWAAADDPHGRLHPLFYTFEVDGKWVNATTLPMLAAAYPLFLVGGARAVLLLPMLGALLCAFAARALARRLGATTGWPAFWVIGLATPVAIYALDFWEHTLGLGLMLAGFVCLFDVTEERRGWRAAFVGGMLFGAAATMRTEALIYFAVAGVGACLVLLARRRTLRTPFTSGLAMVAGLIVSLGLNQLLEYLIVGGSIRAGRAANTAGAAGTALSTRVQEALITTFGLNGSELGATLFLGVLVVVLLAYAVWRLTRPGEGSPMLGLALIGVATVLVALRFANGLGFMSGLLVASPFAVVGAFLGWRRSTAYPLMVAVAALPMVWAFQYSGGAGPQWGGRYELMSGALLAIVGIVTIERNRMALIAVVTMSALVTAFGLAWLSQRSTTVASGMETLLARHDQAVISLDAHALREGGDFYLPARHWLTATSGDDLREAVSIVAKAGDGEFALVADDGTPLPAEVGGYARRGEEHIALLRPDLKLRVVTYEVG